MGEPVPKKKAVHPNTLAAGRRNLRPNTQYLKRGGKKPREFVTQPQLDFLNYLLDGAAIRDAWRWSGMPSSEKNAYEILKRPLLIKTRKELEEKRKDQSVELAAKRREERDVMLHHELGHRLRTMKTHRYRGDEAVVKLIEVGFKSTGSIQATRVSATAGAQAAASAEAGAVDIYKPLWLREAESQLLEQARKTITNPQSAAVSKQLTPERAKLYLSDAGGDKERAREAARKDGWQV